MFNLQEKPLLLKRHEIAILESSLELHQGMTPINKKLSNLIIQIRSEVTSKPEFLFSRQSAEENARSLLNSKAGAFTTSDMNYFLNLCNTEIVPPNLYSNKLRRHETCTRFQLAFIGQNRKFILNSLDSCNHWIKHLWEENGDQYDILSHFWANSLVPGAGIGLPTMILYLKDPYLFNVWLPFLNDTVSLFAGKRISTKRDIKNYQLYNFTINQKLREPFNLEPQEIDYILYHIKAYKLKTSKRNYILLS